MKLPLCLDSLISFDEITLEDFPDDDYCHACHGEETGCVACQINNTAMERFRRIEIMEREADGC